MSARLRSAVPWVALPLLALGAVVSFYVLPAMRADARGRILARVRALQESGAPLSRAELVAPVNGDEAAARELAGLLENNAFDPWQWEPPAGSSIAPEDFFELVETQVFEEDLSEDERAAVAGWIEDHREDLEAIRGKTFVDLTTLGVTPGELTSVSGACRMLSAEAVLAAGDGDVARVLAALTDSFALACVNDDHPLAVTFLGWVYGTSFPLAAARRAVELLPEDADLSPLLDVLDSIDVEARLRTAFLGERVYYLEAMGLVRDGRPAPEDEFVFRRRSPWEPLSWPPFAEWGVLDDLRVLDALIEGGTATRDFPLPERTSGVVRTLAGMDVVEAARAHAADLARLRASLGR